MAERRPRRRKRLTIAAAVAVLVAAALWWQKPWVLGIPLAEPGRTGQRIDKPGVFGNYFPATARAPGVLLLGGSEGGLDKDVAHTAMSLQSAGFSVLQLAYFGGPHQPTHLERVPLETFDRGLRWLKKQPDVIPDRVAVVGHSKGAEAALLVGARDRGDVRAVIAAAPSSVAWNGIDFAFPINPGSSWTSHSRPIASLPYPLWRPWKSIGSLYTTGLRHISQHRDAQIAIERITAPVLLLCGGHDKLWPSCPMSRALVARARDHGKNDVEVAEFAKAGHLLFGPRLPAHASALHNWFTGGSASANNAARAAGWDRVIAFLRRSLGP